MDTTTQTTTLELADPRDLPGHEHGRQRLLAALHGETPRCIVTGRWQHDQFVVTTIDDVYDDGRSDGEPGWLVRDFGSPLYPQAV